MGASGTLRVGRRNMYKSFRVKNFRCFRDLQINDLGRVNLIAGKNNTGKTALLEAMYVLTQPLTPQTLFDLHSTRGLVHSDDEDRRDTWQRYFHESDTGHEIVLHGVDTAFNGENRTLSIKECTSDESYMNHIAQYAHQAKQLGLIGEGTLDIRGTSLLLFSFNLPNSESEKLKVYLPSKIHLPVYTNILFDQRVAYVPAQGRPSTKWLVDNFSEIDKQGRLAQLIGSLAIFESNLSDLRLLSLSGDLTIWGQVNSHQSPLKLMGEGVNRFSNFAIAMIAERPQYLLIDEIENGIHHTVQKEVWKAIGDLASDPELNIQLFATTHSLEMIRAAYEAFSEEGKLEEFRYHRLSRSSKTGDIKATTYNELDMEAVAAFGFEHEVR